MNWSYHVEVRAIRGVSSRARVRCHEVEEADERTLVVAALDVVAEKVEQLTYVVVEGFVSHW